MTERDELSLTDSGREQSPAADSGPPRRRFVVVGLLVALALAVSVLAFAVWPRHKPQVNICFDVGLKGPIAASPDAAFAAWLDASTTQTPLAEWRSHPSETGWVAYENTQNPVGQVATSGYPAFHSVGVTPTAGGWAVDGGCV